MYLDPDYFDIFGLKFEKGTSCVEPRTTVQTKEMVRAVVSHADAVTTLMIRPQLFPFPLVKHLLRIVV